MICTEDKSEGLSRTPKMWRRGVALVWTALLLLLLILMMGLSIDWGKSTYNLHELQNAADSAALAAAQWVKVDQVIARDRGQLFGQFNDTETIPVAIERNEGNDPVGEMIIGRFDKLTRTFTPTLLNPNAVKVVAHRTNAAHGPIATIFGSMVGVGTMDITRQAIARSTGATGAGLICLNHTEVGSLTIGGDVTLDVDGGDIMVNSNDPRAVIINGGANFFECGDLKTCGDVRVNGGTVEELPMYVDNYVPDPAPDPLAHLDPPDYSAWTDTYDGAVLTKVSLGETLTLSPGLHEEGFEMSGGDVTFLPGIHVFTSTTNKPALKIDGGNLIAEGVMIFIGSGSLDLTGNGTILLTAPDPELYTYPLGEQTVLADYYRDVSIFQARDNTEIAKITGTTDYDFGGVLYFSGNHLDLSGRAGTTFRPGDQLICDTANLQGTCTFEINYNGKNVIEGFRSVLVK